MTDHKITILHEEYEAVEVAMKHLCPMLGRLTAMAMLSNDTRRASLFIMMHDALCLHFEHMKKQVEGGKAGFANIPHAPLHKPTIADRGDAFAI